MNIASREEILPLTPQASAVLLSLSNGEKHGYAIADWCRNDSDNCLVMSAGSTYTLLARLQAQGLVEAAGNADATASPFKRKLYQLTEQGRQVLEWEADRQGYFANLARQRLQDYHG